jgi:hypothetical protein
MFAKSEVDKIMPKEFYWYVREKGEHVLLLDIRDKDSFQQFHIFGSINLPASSTKLEDIHDVYINPYSIPPIEQLSHIKHIKSIYLLFL